MAKKRKKEKSNTGGTVLMAVPRALEKDVRDLIREEQASEQRRNTPINRDKLYTKEDRAIVREAESLIKQLKKPMKRIGKVIDRLEELDSSDLSKDDDKWVMGLLDHLTDIKEAELY